MEIKQWDQENPNFLDEKFILFKMRNCICYILKKKKNTNYLDVSFCLFFIETRVFQDNFNLQFCNRCSLMIWLVLMLLTFFYHPVLHWPLQFSNLIHMIYHRSPNSSNYSDCLTNQPTPIQPTNHLTTNQPPHQLTSQPTTYQLTSYQPTN